MTAKKFFLWYLVYGGVLAALSYALQQYFSGPAVFANHYWVYFVFLYVITGTAYFVSYVGMSKGGQLSAMSILGGIIVKMLFAMAFALVYIKKIADNQVVFALNYFSLYLLFSAFEVMGLLSNLRHQNNSEKSLNT